MTHDYTYVLYEFAIKYILYQRDNVIVHRVFNSVDYIRQLLERGSYLINPTKELNVLDHLTINEKNYCKKIKLYIITLLFFVMYIYL